MKDRTEYLKKYYQSMPNDKRLTRIIYRQLHALARPDLTKKNLKGQYRKHRFERLLYSDLIRVGFGEELYKRQRLNRRKRKYGKLSTVSERVHELQKELKWQEKQKRS